VRKFYTRGRAFVQAPWTVRLQRTTFLIIENPVEENGNKGKLEARKKADDTPTFTFSRLLELL
jgi:hypothetical protein